MILLETDKERGSRVSTCLTCLREKNTLRFSKERKAFCGSGRELYECSDSDAGSVDALTEALTLQACESRPGVCMRTPGGGPAIPR